MNLKLLFKNVLLLGLFLCASLTSVFSQDTDPKNDVMFQGFWWDSYQDPSVSAEGGLYNYLKARAPQLQAAGFDVVWTPPPSQGDGMGYFPKQLFNYNNAHGSEAQLRALLADLTSRGVHGMADIVANHRSGTNAWADFTNPTWDCNALAANDEVKGVAGQIQPCSGQNDEGEGFPGCRDLNHKSPQVQQGFRDYLNNLKGLGFDSWRYDFTKGFPAHYVGEYNASSSPYFTVGEYWDANIGLLTSWVNNSGNTFTGTTKRSSTFDFSLYYILSRAINNGNWYELNNGGKMPGLAGTYGYADYAVTFAENHDTHEISGTTNILKANAYILTHPGIPMVFSKHWLDNKTKINELIAVRKQNNITAWSSVNVVESTGYYAAYIDNKVAVKIGPGFWSPTGTGWILNTSGTDYAVWSKINITTPEVAPEAFLNISLIGTAVGGWGTDVSMETTDGITYKLYSQAIAAGKAKFRANQSWSANWGAATFPTGTGVSYGAEIPTVAGTYNITFNRQTGAYSFSAPTAPPANNYTLLTVVGPAVGGWGTDVVFPTNDGITYTLKDYNFVGGALKIRQDNAWTKNWGSAAFPSGTGIQDGADIPVPAGVYTLTFNILTGAYTFYGTDHKVGIIGTAVGGWATDIDMTSKDNGVNYTLDYTFTTGEVKFRKDDAWTVNWGAATFPTGTGILAGPNIPVTAGTYKVSFNATTGAYNFQQVSTSIVDFSPVAGSAGATVTISGSNFTGATAVKFGGVNAASFTIVNPSTITAVVGAGATGLVTVETPLSTASSSVSFTLIPLTKVKASICGTTLAASTSSIQADAVTGAQMYRFEVTNGSTVRTIETATNSFRLSDLTGGAAAATTYAVKVAVKVAGVWGAYGTSCNVSTASPTTKLGTTSCNVTLPRLDTTIYAISVSGATAYKFQVTIGSEVRTIESSSNSFKLTQLSGTNLYNAVYSVRVALLYNGIWRSFGDACNVTTPPLTTTMKSSQCGTTLTYLNSLVSANAHLSAEMYRFQVVNGGTTRTYDTASNSFRLTQLSGGATYSTTYQVRVSVRANNIWGPYSASCSINTPSASAKQALESEDIVETNLYPNPYSESFKIAFSSEDETGVQILIYDASGRLVSQKEANASNIKNDEFGQNLATGVYTVLVQQGERVETLRVVKQ